MEREVRQSWAALEAAKRRFRIITQQAELALEVRQAYEQEILVGARSLLDILNTQNAYFQAQANQINAAAVKVFAEYRVLAAAGILLSSLGLQPPEDALVYAREQMGVPGRNRDGDEAQIDAGSFRDWRRSISTTGD